jgi:hypothetical protein
MIDENEVFDNFTKNYLSSQEMIMKHLGRLDRIDSVIVAAVLTLINIKEDKNNETV